MKLQENLRLNFISLKNGEQWSQSRSGLAVLLIECGVGNYTSGKVGRLVRPGDVLVLTGPATAKVEASAGPVGLEGSGFSVDLELLYPLLGVGDIAKLQPLAERLKSGRVYLAGSGIAEECKAIVNEARKTQAIRERSEMLRVAAHVLVEEFKNEKVSGRSLDSNVSRGLERLTHDELITLSVEELAGKFACTRRHLNRIFHQAFGASVAAIRMEMRLLKAVSLLRQKKTKVIDVAEKCGFNHLSLFNSCFKRRFAMSPGEWRKQHEENGHSEAAEGCPLLRQGLCVWGHEVKLGNGNGNGHGQAVRPGLQSTQLPGLSSSVAGVIRGEPLRVPEGRPSI